MCSPGWSAWGAPRDSSGAGDCAWTRPSSRRNIHYPTDSTLLADGVRVLTRILRRLGAPVRERTRSIARRVFEIAQRSRTTGARTRPAVGERTRAPMKILYQGLLRIARRVVRDAEGAGQALAAR